MSRMAILKLEYWNLFFVDWRETLGKLELQPRKQPCVFACHSWRKRTHTKPLLYRFPNVREGLLRENGVIRQARGISPLGSFRMA